MKTSIQFIKDKNEKVLPIIYLTKSKNGETGTATFIFIRPTIFNKSICKTNVIKGIYLICNNTEIFSNDIQVFFKQGKPFLLKAILIFKNNKEWFNFLYFMNLYSKQHGLSFTDNKSF